MIAVTHRRCSNDQKMQDFFSIYRAQDKDMDAILQSQYRKGFVHGVLYSTVLVGILALVARKL
jgi:hypothetical protein